MIENRRWQNIPGAPQASLYPLIREAGATCANSWIIQSAHALVVIDPGADPAQTDQIIEILEIQLFVRSRPVLVLLTHCHRDHAWACEPLLARGLAQAILIHHAGLDALETRNVELTMAGLFGEPVPQLNALVPLFSASGPATFAALPWKSVSGDAVLLGVPEAPSSERALPSRQCLELGAGAKIEILAMPGHSPDSVIFRLGDLWFVGDLLLAANPGVAGIPGWDARSVVHSLQMFRDMVSEWPPLCICGGHGPIIPGSKLPVLADNILDQARSARDLERLDAKRAHFLKRYVVAVLGECADLLTAIGGRIQFVAFQLEQMEESDEAARIAGLIDDLAIESLVADFRQFATHADAASLTMALPLKGLQIIGKIRAIIQDESLRGLVEPGGLLRVHHLMADYCNTLKGIPVRETSRPVNLNPLVVYTLDLLKPPPAVSTEWQTEIDDQASFTRALAGRIAARSLYQTTCLIARTEAGLPLVSIDPAVVEAALLCLIERLSLQKVFTIQVSTRLSSQAGGVDVEIRCGMSNLAGVLGERRIDYLNLSFARYEAEFRIEPEQTEEVIRMRFPAFPKHCTNESLKTM